MIARHGSGGAIRITALNPIMRRDHALRISERPEKTWRRLFEARSELYALDPKGPEARVRLMQKDGAI